MPAGLACSRYSMLRPNCEPSRQLAEAGQVVRGGDEAQFADTALDEGGER